MKKKKHLTDEEIRTILANQIAKIEKNFPEWDDNATQRLVEMMRPYNEGQIRKIALVMGNTNLVEKVIQRRSKMNVETVISEEAKENLKDDSLDMSKVVVKDSKKE